MKIRRNAIFSEKAGIPAYMYGYTFENSYLRIHYPQDNKKQEINQSTRRKYWFAMEYSIMDGFTPYFDSSAAKFVVKRSRSSEIAKKEIYDQYDMPDNYNEHEIACPHFGRVERFRTKDEAVICIKKWRRESRMVNNNPAIEKKNESQMILINGIKFFYDPGSIQVTETLMAELERFSLDAEDEAYSFYYDGGNLIIY